MNEPTKLEPLKPSTKPAGLVVPTILCLLVMATLAAYWLVLQCDFVNYDDPDYFSANPHVLAGLTPGNIGWALTTGETGNWHPLTWLSLMLDANLFGPGPAGPHVTNLFFHLANTVLLFVLLRRLSSATWRSALVAALFALHPLHVESVAWVSERKDVLSAFFALLSLLFYTRDAQNKLATGGGVAAAAGAFDARLWTRDYILALSFFAAGLMSKPMVVTLPAVMWLLDWWPLRRFNVQNPGFSVRSLIREKWPFLLLSVLSCRVTFVSQQKGGALTSLTTLPLISRLENAFVGYARYLGKIFWPVNLANPYPYPGHWPAGLVIFAVVLVVGVSVAVWSLRRQAAFVAVGWFWFVGTLIPVTGLVQVGTQSMADRYTYLPSIGIFVIIAWSLGRMTADRAWRKGLAGLAAGTALLACAGATHRQVQYWQNNETLFNHTLSVTENNYLAYNNLGTCLSKKGQLNEALDCFQTALQIRPDNPDVLYNLGNVYARLGRWDEAITNYQRALQLTPDQADILNNLGFALATRKQLPEAIACFEAALKINPDSASTHNNLAAILFQEHRLDEAVEHYRAALRITPDDPRIYLNLGDALLRLKKPAEALPCYQAALRLSPNDPQIQARLKLMNVP